MKCCNEDMKPTGGDLGNGWECPICGNFIYDVASVKMAGNFEKYLGLSDDQLNQTVPTEE
jgi:hypothetical protein